MHTITYPILTTDYFITLIPLLHVFVLIECLRSEIVPVQQLLYLLMAFLLCPLIFENLLFKYGIINQALFSS